MSMFNDVISAVYAAIKRLAEESWGEYKAVAIKDGEAFVSKTKADLELWTTQLAKGELTRYEFEFLLLAKQELATLEALKQEGLAATRLAKFRSALIGTIADTVTSTVLGLSPVLPDRGEGVIPPPPSAPPAREGDAVAPEEIEVTERPSEGSASRRVLYNIGDVLRWPRGRPKAESAPVKEGTRIYPVWYGTNRKPSEQGDSSNWYSGERDEEAHYGVCRIAIPKSHKIGSLGSGWFKRFITGEDDRLKVIKHQAMVDAGFWADVASALAKYPQGERSALVYIHGYNTTFEEAALRAAQIGFDLKVPGITAFYSWPSKGTVLGYAADEATIDACEPHIVQFLTRLTETAKVERVHIIAHSMGNRGLLRAVHEIAGHTPGVSFGQIFLAAPDVDTGLFKSLADAYRQVSERTTLYASSKDKALELSGTLHDYPRAGHRPPVTVIKGIDTIDVSEVDLSFLGHGYFAEQRPVLQDMHDLILHDESPEHRLGLIPITEDGGYWRIGE